MLEQINSLFSSLDSRDVNYCHWKSNKKIQQTVQGKTDLDILCHHNDVVIFREILRDNGFVKLDDVVFTGYPGIENYIGYNPRTGRCIHVHLHFKLTIGTPFLKEYVTSWGPYVLERKIIDPETGVPTTDPTTELFLLIVRYSMKIRRYNPLARRSYFQEFLEEYNWLVERADESELETIALDLLNQTAAMHIKKVLNGRPTIGDFFRVGKSVRAELELYNTYASWTTIPLALIKKGFRGIGKLNREWLNRPYPSRRKLPNSGTEIAIIGIDGSGKSTHLSSLLDWLSWKTDIHSVYFGSGDGPSSLLRYPLKKLNGLRNRFNSINKITPKNKVEKEDVIKNQDDVKDKINKKSVDTNVGFIKGVWAVLLAHEKQKKRRRAIRAKNRGMIVLMDRYPQSQFNDINDGPLLEPWIDSNSKMLNKIAIWEREIYRNLHNESPDLIIKLITGPEVAKNRKPETQMINLQQKANIIQTVKYENSKVVSVDTHNDIENVLKDIKNKVWAEI